MLAAALLPLSAQATETTHFRCKQELVGVGDSRATVLQRCGEPALRDSFCARPALGASRPPGGRGPARCEDVDEWTYNPGWGQFWTTLRFEEGRVVSIRYGDRVK